MTIQTERAAEDHRPDADSQIELQSSLRAHPHDERLLACQAVVIPIAEVIHDQQRIDHQSAGHRRQEHLPRQVVNLHIVRAAHRHQSEEHQHQHVAQALV